MGGSKSNNTAHKHFRSMRSLAVQLLGYATLSNGFSIPTNLHHQRINGIRSATVLRSIPNSIDTFASGLASIARLPRGVTVSKEGVSLIGPAAPFLPKIKKLYDVENNRECRTVRERITEYDLVVENVIPAAANSRASAESLVVVPTMVAEIDGKEQSFVGVDAILNFLDDKFSTVKKEEAKMGSSDEIGEEEDGVKIIFDKATELLAYCPGILRAGRGSSVCSAASLDVDVPRPTKPLVLYSYEGNQFCRLVREVMTELDLVYELRSAGKQSPRREELASITGGSSQCPYLIDNNTGVKMAESKDIIAYLYKTYAVFTPPNELLQYASGVTTLLAPLFKAIAPLQAGSYKDNEFEYKSELAEAKAAVYEEIASGPVVIYTYELSPFCTEATVLLENCGIRYKEVSLGKEWIPGLIKDPAKRAALLEITGQSSLPNIFIGGTSIGGLFSGSPGLVPALERGQLMKMIDDAKKSMM